MNVKWIFPLSLLATIVVYYSFNFSNKTDPKKGIPVFEQQNNQAIDQAWVTTIPHDPWKQEKLVQKTWVVDEGKLQSDERLISKIIDEINLNLNDKEKKDRLKQQLAGISESYKQEVLAKVKKTLAE